MRLQRRRDFIPVAKKNIVTADEGYGRWAMDPMLMEQTNMETKMVRPMRRVIVTNDMREVE